jgi:uncharacterized damage-inducible protein DinB
MTDSPEPATESEIEVLERYLDAYRGAAKWKVSGLTLEQATRSLVPSSSTLLGILKHLAFVERWWFQSVVDGREVDFPDSEADLDADFRIEAGETVASVVQLFDAECEISRTILAERRDPGERIAFRDGSLALRDILVHMAEESARHVGHMDILRELIDGATGGFPPNGLPWD